MLIRAKEATAASARNQKSTPREKSVNLRLIGRSRNVIEAFELAEAMNLKRLALLGSDGGGLLALSDVALVVPAWNTQRIQEVQILVIHLLCELIEERLFGAHATHGVAHREQVRGAGAPPRLGTGSINWRMRGRAALDRVEGER